jgi:hypothetical protein
MFRLPAMPAPTVRIAGTDRGKSTFFPGNRGFYHPQDWHRVCFIDSRNRRSVAAEGNLNCK